MLKSRLFALVAALAASSAQATCLWADPGANPFTGDPAAAINSYADIPPQARAELVELVQWKAHTAIVEIRRDSIGAGAYTNMRAMHWGDGQQCMGAVDRSTWKRDHIELAPVYCVRGHCVIIPRVCGNVARVNRVGSPPQPDPVATKRTTIQLGRGPVTHQVPEPGTVLLVLVALAVVAFLRARKPRR